MNTSIPDNNTHHGGYFLMGLLAGSAVGAGLAVYFAPRLREELRQRVIDSTDDLRNSARDGVADVVARGAHQVRKGAYEVARGAREVEEFAKASKTEVA